VATEVDRRQVLAYRVAAHEFDRAAPGPGALAVLDLGVADVPQGSARLALAARTDGHGLDDPSLAVVWAARGAPHLHRLADVPALARALWPLDDADASARIANPRIAEGARLGLDAFRVAARAMRDVVTEPIGRGEVSTAVSARIPASLTYWCTPCDAQHISGALFQQVGIFSGVRLVPGTSPAVLAPIEGRPDVPKHNAGADSLVSTYLRLLGPATPAEVAKYLGMSPTTLRRAWPDDLAEVRVDGRRAWLPADRLDALRTAPTPRLVRLLPPADPFLQARDRALLVPDKAHQAQVWRILGNPGGLLVDGEIAGVWRARLAGKARLELTVTPFAPLGARVRNAIEAEARRVADARGAGDIRVRFDD